MYIHYHLIQIQDIKTKLTFRAFAELSAGVQAIPPGKFDLVVVISFDCHKVYSNKHMLNVLLLAVFDIL